PPRPPCHLARSEQLSTVANASRNTGRISGDVARHRADPRAVASTSRLGVDLVEPRFGPQHVARLIQLDNRRGHLPHRHTVDADP
ncbi:MAG: hypothetical protein WCP59_17780, partial [Actinomycetota bacterium]